MTDTAPTAQPGMSFEERVFGPLVDGRECGDCTACCFEITIDDPNLAKPPRQSCVNCTSEGCSIYPTRPQSCRVWFCAWRRLAALPDALSPDKSGLLASLVENPEADNPLARLYIIVQWLDERPVTRSEVADALLAAMRRYALPVWVGSGDRMSLHFPRQEIALHLMHGSMPPAPLAAEVTAWRSRIPGSLS